ncbi:putative mycofactocin biosynthesis glycosyltransferase MftF [Abditibacteriota bacterium]|nr:putative mycofactocin biosynthesis glycosyltransferase MftF [Abditibacteriota bacterium]
MTLSVVIPVHNAREELEQCLRALREGERQPDEIIVVDDASTDDSARIAQSYEARVLVLNHTSHGPAVARNRGAAMAEADVIVFLDADVVVHPDTLARIEHHFATEPDVAALFGSYDDHPSAPGIISRYYNLRHHWTHQHGATEANTFWSGCGAIRRPIFLQTGGFDESYARPSVEDIALGRRLRTAGHRIRLCPNVQVTHLKKWTLRSWLQTDIWGRAVPWTQMLIREGNSLPNDLNLDWKSRASAVLSWLFVLFLFMGCQQKLFWLAALGALIFAIGCNWRLLRFFARQGGMGFALGAGLCHGLYFLYSSATFAFVSLDEKVRFNPQRLQRTAFLCLLVAALLKGIAWSLIVPPWQAPDEPQHYLYGFEIGRQHTTHIVTDSNVPSDAWQLATLSPHYKFVPGQQLNLSDPKAVESAIIKLDNDKTERVRDDGRLLFVRGFERFHPPGYFLAVAGVLEPLKEAGIRRELMAARWLSVLLGVLTVALSVGIGREIWPRRDGFPLLLGILVAFQPMNAFTQATVTNDAALITVFTVLLLLLLRVMRCGMSIGRGVALGAVLTLGLMTKMSFACAVPLVVSLLLWRLWREKQVISRRKIAPSKLGRVALGWTVALVLPAVVATPWYVQTLKGGNSKLIQSSFTNANQLPRRVPTQGYSTSWEKRLRWQFIASTPARDVVNYTRVTISYWGNFGWVNVRVPSALWIFLLLVSIGIIVIVPRRLMREKKLLPLQQRRALWWLGFGTLALVAFYVFVDWRTRLSTGSGFGLRGGYYLPAIAGQMAWLMMASETINRNRWRFEWGLGFAMVLLNFYCLFGVVGFNFYGTGAPWQVAERAAILQPVNHVFISLVCGGMITTSALLLTALRDLLKTKISSSVTI